MSEYGLQRRAHHDCLAFFVILAPCGRAALPACVFIGKKRRKRSVHDPVPTAVSCTACTSSCAFYPLFRWTVTTATVCVCRSGDVVRLVVGLNRAVAGVSQRANSERAWWLTVDTPNEVIPQFPSLRGPLASCCCCLVLVGMVGSIALLLWHQGCHRDLVGVWHGEKALTNNINQ